MSTGGSGSLSAPGREGSYSPVMASWERGHSPSTPASTTSQGGERTPPRARPGMLPLLMLRGPGNCKSSYFLSPFSLGLAVDSVSFLVPRGSLPLANSDIF